MVVVAAMVVDMRRLWWLWQLWRLHDLLIDGRIGCISLENINVSLLTRFSQKPRQASPGKMGT